jgi:tetratricopeptide (TPR) repeat protein
MKLPNNIYGLVAFLVLLNLYLVDKYGTFSEMPTILKLLDVSSFILLFAGFVKIIRPKGKKQTHIQKTEGDSSPIMRSFFGNVNFSGVNPDVVNKMLELIDKKDIELEEKRKEAEEWAKKYRELKEGIETAPYKEDEKEKLSSLISEGQFEEAGKLLDGKISEDEKAVETLAATHYSRAKLFELEFKPLDALPHYEKAYSLDSGSFVHSLDYGLLLLEQNMYEESEKVLELTLSNLRNSVAGDKEEVLTMLAATLNNLAILYRNTNRFQDAEVSYDEALESYRELAEGNRPAYLPYVATTLNNLGNFYTQTNQPQDAEVSYNEALNYRRELAEANRPVYLIFVATTLSNLGNLHAKTNRLQDAENAYNEALRPLSMRLWNTIANLRR